MITPTSISVASLIALFGLAANKPTPMFTMMGLCAVLALFVLFNHYWETHQLRSTQLKVNALALDQANALRLIIDNRNPMLGHLELIRYAERHIRPLLTHEQNHLLDDRRLEHWVKSAICYAP